MYKTFRKKATSEIDDVKENAQKSFAYFKAKQARKRNFSGS